MTSPTERSSGRRRSAVRSMSSSSSHSKVLVGNVHIMMAYAFRSLSRIGDAPLATTEFEHIHDLLADIVARETTQQVKRGLDHNYLERASELVTVRGRVDLQESIRTRSVTRGALVCRYDEYVADTPVNQAVRATVLMLARSEQVAAPRRDALARLLPFFSGVRAVPPRTIRWSDLRLHRANASYRWLLGACDLAVKGLLPADGSGDALLPWLSDETMSSLFERFVREYFRFHHPQLGARAALVPWDVNARGDDGAVGLLQLPTMRTDITLQREDAMLVIDTKYYRSPMQISQFGTRSLHSGNLYQISAYVQHASALHDQVSGLLLYARTNGPVQPDLDAVLAGHRIGASTLDLTKPWAQLQEQLEGLLLRF